MMRRLLFVDHDYHQRTKSADFFVDLIRDHFEVFTIYLSPSSDIPDNLINLAESVDVVVIWQLDYLAPVFLALGVPTVVIPMYDGSALMPDLHWLWSCQGRFLNFSLSLHERIRMLRCVSHLLRYFPEPAAEARRARFDKGLRVFLWQRRPEDGINVSLVERLFGDQIAHLHVHNSPDAPRDPWPVAQRGAGKDYNLTVSSWFETKNDYLSALEDCNTFIAPRISEGIGMAFLEAMSRGMLVLASDQPTHTEYIANWVNGVLFNPNSSGYANFADAASMGQLAWSTVCSGREQWLRTAQALPEIIAGTPRPRAGSKVDVELFARQLSAAYRMGREGYTMFLLRHIESISEATQRDLRKNINNCGNLELQPVRNSRSLGIQQYPWLDSLTMRPKDVPLFALDGRVAFDGRVAWVIGNSLSLGFHLDLSMGTFTQLKFALEFPQLECSEQPVFISINDIPLAAAYLKLESQEVVVDIPVSTLRADNVLRVSAFYMGTTPLVSGPTSFGISNMQIM